VIEPDAIATTVKLTPLLAVPSTVTTTLPVVAPEGTLAIIEESVQVATEAVVPLNVTVPGVEPKFVPVIVTDVPTAPDDGDRPLMLGVVTIVKLTPLLALPPAVTTTFPDEAPDGTLATIDESPQLTIGAVVPLNVTVPGVEPKFVPVIVTDVPTTPDDGDRLVMLGGVGGCVTKVKSTPLLALPPAVTTTFPEEAPDGTITTIDELLQLMIGAVVPLNVANPGVEPKFVPVIVTDAPTTPDDGDRLIIVGVAGVWVTDF
jgi:hypothetical protein